MDINLIKLACSVISKSLESVINLSFDNGIVYGERKKARVTPIYKNKWEMNYENNFRPISMTSHFDKMIENLVSTQVVDYLEFHKYISID